MGKLKKSIGDTSRIVRYMWYAFGGIVVLIMNTDGKRIVYSANAGDSRSLLYTNGKTVRLSVVHTDHSLLPIGPQGCGSRGDEAN